ncbi:MAG: S8 family serine peptidase [Syntrophales bacterium]|nr:S8 family serine peptidase [Syntrophales bacterium]MDD5531820.1 S8 family serine peptidase [Syntrophales bacterium]
MEEIRKLKGVRFLRVILLILLACSAGAAAGIPSHRSCGGGDQYVPDELLVKFKRHADVMYANQVHSRIGARRVGRFSSIGVDRVRLPARLKIKDAAKEYLQDPAIEYAEPNYLRRIERTPDDPYYGLLWALRNTGQEVNGSRGTPNADIKASIAWDKTTGNGAIVVAVIDSGADYNHPDLAGNIWVNPGEVLNGGDDDGNGYNDDVRGWDFVDGDNDPMDPQGHGTHVSGAIAAGGNNALGVTGVSWSAKVMAVRGIDAYGYITVADFISALDYARANGARIANCSFGGTGFSQSEYNAIAAAGSAGMLVVASAGNNAADNDASPRYPSAYDLDNIISVASSTQNDTLSWFSNFGKTSVDLAAPGENIYSSRPSRQTVWSDNFDDGSIAYWATGGTGNLWGLSSAIRYSSDFSLAVSPAGNYSANMNAWASSPAINLSGQKGCKLQFVILGAAEVDTDQLYMETSTNGTTWTAREIEAATELYGSYSRSTGGSWVNAMVDFGAFDNAAAVYFRFRFYSNGSVQNSGYYIDNVCITSSSASYPGPAGQYYKFMNGTSMSAPMVSGAAALVWGLDPSRTYIQVRDAVVNSTDPKASLSEKCSSGGRLNADNAINYINDPAAWSVFSPSGGESSGGGGGCFIATAAFGSPAEPEVLVLKRFRDEVLMRSEGGRLLVRAYYRASPPAARVIAGNGFLCSAARIAIMPLLASAWLILQPSVLVFPAAVLIAAFVFMRIRRPGN